MKPKTMDAFFLLPYSSPLLNQKNKKSKKESDWELASRHNA